MEVQILAVNKCSFFSNKSYCKARFNFSINFEIIKYSMPKDLVIIYDESLSFPNQVLEIKKCVDRHDI